MRRLLITLLWLACPLVASAQTRVPLYGDLGSHEHRISTSNPQAQAYFNQGLRLTYGFNHAEAIRSFRAAQELDPQCAMCFWGEALAYGPNINAAMDSASAAAAWAAISKAQQLSSKVTAQERAYIDALRQRYNGSAAGQAPRDTLYARAMQQVTRAFSSDDDAHVLHADAQMNLSPWDYYRDTIAKPNAAAALASLETVLQRSPDHAGACHFFIHAVEAVDPERAVPCAERLPALMPGAGHIVHMPAHIYIRVGRYEDAIERNVHALHADEQHIADLAPDGPYRLGYYPHNSHFLWFAATMAGREQTAIDAAIKTRELTPLEKIREPGLGALQHYRMTPVYAYVRFARWQDVLREPAPPSDVPYMMGVWHYARALAFINAKDIAKAEAELTALRAQRQNPALASMAIWGLNPGAGVLDVAIAVVQGEIAQARGDLPMAIKHFRQGVVLEEALLYDEPPTWHLPVRHSLGKALLQAGDAAGAERAFREDLKRHPKNAWAMAGLQQAISFGKTSKTGTAKPALKTRH